jgi:hypothetical protein
MSYKTEFSSDKGWSVIDTNIRLNTKKGAQFRKYLKDNGVHTIIRYYASSRRAKTITAEEAKVISKDGFNILPVYQDVNRKPSDFGYAKGKQSAINALDFAEWLKQPEGSAIMFAVDTDMNTANIRKYVIPFFKGIRDGLDGRYVVGAYGPGTACKILLEEDLIEIPWLTMSRAFNGTKSMFYSGKWAMRQVPPPLKWNGIHYDKNVLNWKIEDMKPFRYNSLGNAYVVGGKDVDNIAPNANLVTKLSDWFNSRFS